KIETIHIPIPICSFAGYPSTPPATLTSCGSSSSSRWFAVRSLPDQSVYTGDGLIEALLVGAGEAAEGTVLHGQLLDKGLVHPFADLFAVAGAVLDKGRVDVGQQVE